MVSYMYKADLGEALVGLNPCCSGQWSSTLALRQVSMGAAAVLILVVVDNGLVRAAAVMAALNGKATS